MGDSARGTYRENFFDTEEEMTTLVFDVTKQFGDTKGETCTGA